MTNGFYWQIQEIILVPRESTFEGAKVKDTCACKFTEKLWWGELENLIQMALLCIQSSPLDRPKMFKVARMLKGQGLEEKWDQWGRKTIWSKQITTPSISTLLYESTSNSPPNELFGPRWSL